MKSIINKLMSIKALVALMIICATSGAWAVAPTPTVIWDGDFSSLSKTVGDVTYSINNIGAGTDNTSVNICASDNSYLQVVNSNNGYAAPTITATGGDAPFGSPENGATVIAFYREMPIGEGSNRAVLSLLSPNDTFNNCHVNAGVCRFGNSGGGNTAASFINGGQWNNGTITQQVLSGGEQMIAFVCKSEGGMSYYINGREISTDSRSLDFTPTGVCLGGMDNSGSSKFFAMINTKILGVAIFDHDLTAQEVAEFSFAKWNTSNKWRYNDTLAYREPTNGTVGDFAYATVAMVGADGVADTSTFALNTPKHHPYTVLNEPSGNYVSPGVALVFDAAGYKAPPQPNFGDLILGGLHVTANRADGVPYALASSTGGQRTTALGDKSGYRESYFVFDESFSISRQGNQNTANTKLYGVVNIEVASGKTFTLNGNGETGNGATIVMTTAGTTAPVLKMAGGGKFKIGTLVASSGTLDFSEVTATPFIQGVLTVDDSTVFKFPAGAVFPYAVATSVNSSMSGNVTFWVGNTSYSDRTLTFTDGAVYPSGESSATFAGGNSGTWAGLDWDINYAGASGHNITVTADGTINLGSASATKVTFDVPDGVTLTLTGTLTASEIYINGNGVVQVSAANTLQGTIKGNGTVKYSNNVRPTTTGEDVVFTDPAWRGTVWLYDYAYTTSLTGGNLGLYPHYWSNSGSKLKFTKVKGYLPGRGNSNVSFAWQLGYEGQTVGELILEDEGDAAAFERVDGFSHSAGGGNSYCKFAGLSGSGTLKDSKDQFIYMVFDRADGFAGTINVPNGTTVIIGAESPTDANWDGKIVVASGADAAVASGKTWTSKNGVVVNGTLTLNASSSALTGTVTGSGTIVANGSNWYPTSIADLRDSSKWTGTVVVNGGGEGLPMVIASATVPANEKSQLTLASGYATVTPDFPGTLNVSSGAHAYLYDASETTTSTSLKIGAFDGTLDFAYATALTTIDLDFGTLRNASGLANIPGGANVNVTLTELKTDNGSITFTAPGAEDFSYTVKHIDGVEIYNVAKDGSTSNSATLTYTATTGSACWMDYEFEGNLDNIGTEGTALRYDTNFDANNSFSGGKVMTSTHPWRDVSSYPDNWSAAIRCNTPDSDNATVIMFGSTTTTPKGLIGLITAPTDHNKVILATWSAGQSGYTTNAIMTVTGATTQQHLYVFTKSVETVDATTTTTIMVYCDGEIITKYTTTDAVTFGKGIQFGGAHGGEGASGFTRYADAGVSTIDFVRLYNGVISDAMINQMVKEYPYVSTNGEYSRSLDGTDADWSEANTWTKTGEDTPAYAAPAASAMAALSASADTTVTVNLASEPTYEKLTFDGSGDISLVAGEGTEKVSAASVIVNTDLTVAYGAADFAGARITVASGKVLTFDLSDYPWSSLTGTRTFPVTGLVAVQADERFAVSSTDRPAWITDVSVDYNPSAYCYEITISTDHEAGIDVYYKGGYWGTPGDPSDAFSVTNSSGGTTVVFPGDTVVIPAYLTGGQASGCYFGDLPANVTTIRVDKASYTFSAGVDAAILDGVAIVVPESTTLTFANTQWHNVTLGSVTLIGAGTVVLPSLQSSIRISETWIGTVVLPSFVAEGVNFNNYGKTGSTVALTGITSGWIGETSAGNASVAPTLRLDGNVTLTGFSTSWAYTFAEITGTGNLSFAPADNHPGSLTITKVAEGYSGTISNTSDKNLAIGTLDRAAGTTVTAGSKLLAIGGTGSFSVGSVTVGGVTQSGLQLAYASDGVYVACASYGGNGYTSVAAAIDAAVAAGEDVSTITIHDGSTTLPAGYEQYYIDNGTVCKYRFAVVTVAATTTTNYVATAQAAADAADGVNNKYVVLYTTASIDAARDIMIECVGDVSVTLNCTVAGKSYGEPIAVPGFSGLYNYSPRAIAATFVWNSAVSSGSWSDVVNWECDDGTVTTAPNNALYTEVFESNAEVILGSTVATAGIEIKANVTFSRANDQYPTINGGIVLKTADATLTVGEWVTVSTPTTTVAYSEIAYNAGTRTYSVRKLAEASTVPVAGVGDVEVIDPEEGVTSITVPAGTDKVAIPGTIANISGVTAENLLLKVEYDNGSEQTAYYTNILAVAANGAVSLDGTKSVTVGGVDIPVKPACNGSVTVGEQTLAPMSLNNEGNPMFAFKTIPGLWYVVETSTDGSNYEAGNAVQATGNATAISAALPGVDETVLYYRVGVGASKASAED